MTILEFFNFDRASFAFFHSLLLVVGFYNILRSQNDPYGSEAKTLRRKFAALLLVCTI